MPRISSYDPAQPLDGTEEFIIVQGGGNKKASSKNLLDYSNANILSGRITKVIALSGGDFTSFDELFDWISRTPMISVDLTILIQPGTYNVPEPTIDLTTYTLLGSQLTKIHVVGVDEHNCILNINNSVSGKGFIKATNMYFGMSRLTINNIGEPAFIADVTSSTINFNYLNITNCSYMFTANRSHCEINDCYATCTSAGLYVRESSTLEWGGGSIDGSGVALIGVYCWSNCTIIGNNNPIIKNTQTGLMVGDASRVMMNSYTFTGNGTDFNIPLNIFQGDGGYISDGNLDISGSTAAFELLANKNEPDGYAGLDSGGKIPASLLPEGFGDEVQEYDDYAALPALGVESILYVTKSTGQLYRWDQSEVSPGVWSNIYVNIGNTDGGYF